MKIKIHFEDGEEFQFTVVASMTVNDLQKLVESVTERQYRSHHFEHIIGQTTIILERGTLNQNHISEGAIILLKRNQTSLIRDRSWESTQISPPKISIHDFEKLNSEDFLDWMRAHGFQDSTIDLIGEQELDGSTIMGLTSPQIVEYCGVKIGPAIKLCNLIGNLKNDNSSDCKQALKEYRDDYWSAWIIREHVISLFENNRSLVELDAHSHDLEDGSIIAISKGLPNNTVLKILNFGDNYVTHVGMGILRTAMNKNDTINSLHIYKNRIDGKGAGYVAEIVANSKTLTELDFQENKIGPIGGLYMGNALKINKTLTKLDMGDMGLGPEGVRHLCSALKENTTLKQLYIDGENHFGPIGMQHVCDMLAVNQTLTTLYVGNNMIELSGLKTLCDRLVNGSSIKSLSLESNLHSLLTI